MKVAFIARSTLYSAPGGDTIQVVQTARHLARLGISADVKLTHEKINYGEYSLIHFFNLTRPADILYHARRATTPYVLSPIFIDYSEYDKNHRTGLAGAILKRFSPDRVEYIKTISRWILGKDELRTKSYIWKGQRKSIKEILRNAAMLLPNSYAEMENISATFNHESCYTIVPNGIDEQLFQPAKEGGRQHKLVLCAARIEGIKNQLNLIRALNNTEYTLVLVGSAATNQRAYYKECRRIASSNIQFHEHVPQQALLNYYQSARVHALPSWFETCGLSSLEAAAMGCNLAITDKGYTREYFGDYAFYCNPDDPQSIFQSIQIAASTESSTQLREKILSQYTWKETAARTLDAYTKITAS